MTPKHYIVASDGSTPVYTINNVIERNPFTAIDVPQEVEITNLRSQGAVTISGGLAPYDIQIRFLIKGTDYADVMTQIASLRSAVLVKTNYYLKYDKTLTNNQSLESIKVRVKSIDVDGTRHITRFAFATITLRALAW